MCGVGKTQCALNQRIRSRTIELSYFFPSGVVPLRVTVRVLPSGDTTRRSE